MITATKVYGIDADYTTCDCCGKRNLKSTVAFEDQDGKLQHFGSTCINKAMGKVNGKSVNAFAADIVTVYAAFGKWIMSHTTERIINHLQVKGVAISTFKGNIVISNNGLSHTVDLSVFEETVSWWAD